MKKTLIALAVAGIGFNAMAADLDRPGQDLLTYASELNVANSPEITAGVANGLDVTTTVGFNLNNPGTAAVSVFANIELTDAEFAADVAQASDDVVFTDTSGGTTDLATTAITGGAAGDSLVTVEIEIPTGESLSSNDVLELVLPTLTITGANPSATYSLHLDAVAAAARADAVSTKTGALIDFAPALDEVAFDDEAATLEVSSLYTEFTNGTVTDELASISLVGTSTATAPVYLASGAAASNANVDALLEGATLAVSGDFSAGVKDANGDLDLANVLTGANVTFNAVDSSNETIVLDITGNTILSLKLDGETAVGQNAYTAVLNLTGDASTSTYTLADVNFNPLAQLRQNGDNARVELGLSRNTGFSQFVRLVHNGAVGDEIFVRVTDDAGLTGEFPLSAIEGQSGVLEAGTAAKSINAKALFDAALADEPALDDKGMMRIEFFGNVDDITAQSYVVGADGSAFGQIN